MLTPLCFYKPQDVEFDALLPTSSADDGVVPKSATSPDTAKLRRYILEVNFEVQPAELGAFASQSKNLVPTFEKLGLRPRYSLFRTDSTPTRVVNYWDLGDDANQLLIAELALPDIPRFNTFNTIVRREVKNLVIPIAPEESIPQPRPTREADKLSAEQYCYLRVQCEVANTDFSEFVALVEGYLARFTKRAGWLLGDTFYGITGREGIVSQIWLIPVGDVFNVGRRLGDAPWLQSTLAANIETEILRATPSDPRVRTSGEAAKALSVA
jgi:hypothetical protein